MRRGNPEVEKILNEIYYANQFSIYFSRIGWVAALITFLAVAFVYRNASFSSVYLGLFFTGAVGFSFSTAFNNTYEYRFSGYREKLEAHDEFKGNSPFATYRYIGVQNKEFAAEAKINEIIYLIFYALKDCLLQLCIALPLTALISYVVIRYL